MKSIGLSKKIEKSTGVPADADNPQDTSRRKLLKALGAGGVMLACSGILSPEIVQAASTPNGSSMVWVPTVSELLAIPVELLGEGTMVFVGGYYKDGDGGSKVVRWAPDSAAPDNGGTVHSPEGRKGSTGRWETVHSGVGDFRWFGIFNSKKTADDALEAMVNDPKIHRIEAHSDLWFVRRHIFSRSNIEIDFGCNRVETTGMEDNDLNNPFGALMFFQGSLTGHYQQVTLKEAVPELSDIFEVADSSAFMQDEWWLVRVNPRVGASERELDKLLMVTEIIDATHIRVNYLNGWTLEAGRIIEYRKAAPVFRAHVNNMLFIGSGRSTANASIPGSYSGTNPVAYEYAVECNNDGIEASKSFWAMIMRRYCTHYIINRCKLINPAEVEVGGSGYLAQQINCLYGTVVDCATSNARHLNDFTGAAYCHVENCHADGDDMGAFVTHGQYEHDLSYIGNSGLMSFANSGTQWGHSAKRITVKKHIGSRFVAWTKITDLTMEDVSIFKNAGTGANGGSIWVNADGVQMRGCTADNMITFSQFSSLSKRPNIVEGCSFTLQKGYYISRCGDRAVEPGTDIIIKDCNIYNVDNNFVGGGNRLVFVNTNIYGAPGGLPLQLFNKRTEIIGGSVRNVCLMLMGEGLLKGAVNNVTRDLLVGHKEQEIVIDGGAEFSGSNSDGAFLKSENMKGTVTWSLGNYRSNAPNQQTAHFRIAGGRNKYRALGAQFTGGKFDVSGSAFSNGSYMLHTSCIEEGVLRSALPEESDTVRHGSGNIIV